MKGTYHYFNQFTKRFEPVEGEKIVIPGVDVELILHRGVDWRNDWQITEVKSGSRICTGRTKKEVVEKATAEFAKYLPIQIFKFVEIAVKNMEAIKKEGGGEMTGKELIEKYHNQSIDGTGLETFISLEEMIDEETEKVKKEQDKKTRHACAEAVIRGSYGSEHTRSMYSAICMDCKGGLR